MRNGLQSATLLSLALIQPLVGRIAQLTHRGVSIEERSAAAQGFVTPANGAFAIWGPLFAGSCVLGVRSFFRRSFESPTNAAATGLCVLGVTTLLARKFLR